jgi:flavin-dependent dehydrogenase
MARDVDVVIIGDGLAGIAAAVTAAASGARTLVLERGESIGGSAIISGGYVWALAGRDILHRKTRGSINGTDTSSSTATARPSTGCAASRPR